MIKEYLQAIHPVEDGLLEAYLDLWEHFELGRKEVMTAEGQVEKYMYFVREGLQRSYYLNEGKEHVIAFTYPPSFSGVPDSFNLQRPSKVYLETITPSKFIRIHYHQHMNMVEEHRPLETLYRKFSEVVMAGLLDRYNELMAFDIETRFRNFIQRSPHLLNQIPYKDLASYLRIDATNFSKLLAKVKV